MTTTRTHEQKDRLSELTEHITGSENIPPAGLKWLATEYPLSLFRSHTSHPPCAMSAATDGKLAVSWTADLFLFHAEIDTEARTAYWHFYDRTSHESEDGDINLQDPAGWGQIQRKLGQMFSDETIA